MFKKVIFLMFFIIGCTKSDDEGFLGSDNSFENIIVEPRSINDPYMSGLVYAINPALNSWTSSTGNQSTTCGSYTGNIIKARIKSFSGDVVWLEIVKVDGTKFTQSGNVTIFFESLCGSVATLASQSQSYSSYYSANVQSISIPFVMIPGKSKVIVSLTANGGAGKYHAGVITFNASGWMKSSHAKIERDIVNLARTQIGLSSGISTVNSCYYTDMDDGDFDRWKNAYQVLHSFKIANPNIYPPASIISNMKSKFTWGVQGNPGFNATDATSNVNQILVKYNGSVPSTFNSMMSLNGIRQQCKEKQIKFAISSGGICKPYGSPKVTDPKLYRPGMAVFWKSSGVYRHAMTISEIRWLNNTPTSDFKVIESNWGTGYSKPVGHIPWQRVIALRSLTINSEYEVVDQKQ